MLQQIRKSSRSWLGIVLAAILIPPFAIVGVDYIFRDGFSRASPVIKVGNAEIPGRVFEQEYQRLVQQVQNRLGRPIDYETAKSMGIVRNATNALVTRALYDEASKGLGLTVADSVVRADIQSTPSFRGIGGNFDAERFRAILRNLNLTEAGYVATRKQEIASTYLLSSVRAVNDVPKGYVDRIYKFRNQTRSISYVVVPYASTTVTAPGEAALLAFHKKNTKKYTAPEYRKLTVLIVQPKDVYDRIKLTDADILAVYKKDIGKYTTPEKRAIEQIVFRKEAEAMKAYDAMIGGRSFETVAKEVAKKPIIKLGIVTERSLSGPTKVLADAAFALDKDQVSKPVKSPLGWHLLRVTKIEKKIVKPLADVKKAIADALKAKKAGPILDKLKETADDILGGGLKLAEIAKDLKLKTLQIDAIDSSGRDRSGKAVAGLPEPSVFLGRAFKKKDDYLEIHTISKGGFYVIQVDKVVPSQLIPLKDIRARVTADLTTELKQTAAAKKANALAKGFAGQDSFENAAKTSGLTTKLIKVLKRYGPTGDAEITSALREKIFSAKKDGIITGAGKSGFAIAKLDSITTVDPAKNKAARGVIETRMKQSVGLEILGQYDAYLRKTLKLEIDQKSIDRLFSRDNPANRRNSGG